MTQQQPRTFKSSGTSGEAFSLMVRLALDSNQGGDGGVNPYTAPGVLDEKVGKSTLEGGKCVKLCQQLACDNMAAAWASLEGYSVLKPFGGRHGGR